MEVTSTVIVSGNRGQQVNLTTGSHLMGVNIQIYGVGRDGSITTFAPGHFADVLTALVLGDLHIPALPEFCQCEDCRATRGKAFAERLATAQAERLNQAERNRETNNE